MDDAATAQAPVESPAATGTAIYRHRLATRIWHWVNAVAIFVLIGSGVGILKAHPRLYWGDYGANFDAPWWTLDSSPQWVTTFINAITVPARYNLALSRRWHLFFALVFAFSLLIMMLASLVNAHFQRDLRIRLRDLRPAVLLHDLKAHLALRFHDPQHPLAYNIFQKLSYAGVIFVLIPTMILTGLTMSPAMNAAWPWLLDVFGGRQSARSIHFIAATGLTLFIVVHLVLVILAGPINEVRSMITGWWTVPPDDAPQEGRA